jgi:hypothetical protein
MGIAAMGIAAMGIAVMGIAATWVSEVFRETSSIPAVVRV